jgi:hypothetical protein
MAKEILLGLHDPGTFDTYKMFFELSGFSVTGASSLDEMLEKMGIPKDAGADTAPINHYDAYIMDTNLGDLAGPSYEPAQRIYRHIKQSVENEGVKFMSVTGSDEAFSGAKEHGIPVMIKEFDLAQKLEKYLSE